MKFDSKQLALAYHREFFSSLYDVEGTVQSPPEVPHDRHLTPAPGCGTLEGRVPQALLGVTLCYRPAHGVGWPEVQVKGLHLQKKTDQLSRS